MTRNSVYQAELVISLCLKGNISIKDIFQGPGREASQSEDLTQLLIACSRKFQRLIKRYVKRNMLVRLPQMGAFWCVLPSPEKVELLLKNTA